MEELYESLLKGDEHIIDLCKGKVRFESGNNYVRTKDKFLRKNNIIKLPPFDTRFFFKNKKNFINFFCN